MTNHVKVYVNHHSIGEQDIWGCENCGKLDYIWRFDIHHIIHRSQLGEDNIENLMCLCRECHNGHHQKGKEVKRNFDFFMK